MKQLWDQIEILKSKVVGGKTILQISTSAPPEDIEKYRNKGRILGQIQLDDGKHITGEQRKKIFACIRDVSLFTGFELDYIRDILEATFCVENNIEAFSLSDCSLETARSLINYLIEFCIEWDIPLGENAINRTDDINSYLFMTIKRSICCLCGSQSIVYSIGGKKISLCDKHYDIAKFKGLKALEQLHKVYPIKI